MHGAAFAAVGPKLADNAHTQMTSSNVRLIIGTPKKSFKRPSAVAFGTKRTSPSALHIDFERINQFCPQAARRHWSAIRARTLA
jgi:hypothetical protein